MSITKCDICGKRIEDRQEISVGYLSPLPYYQFCLKCAKPVVVLLNTHKLIQQEKI